MSTMKRKMGNTVEIMTMKKEEEEEKDYVMEVG